MTNNIAICTHCGRPISLTEIPVHLNAVDDHHLDPPLDYHIDCFTGAALEKITKNFDEDKADIARQTTDDTR